MRDTIETDRLRLRPFQSNDAQFAFAWFGDPDVMRFTPSGADRSLAETITRIAGYELHRIKHGFSKWIIVDRASGQTIGDSGLLVLPEYGWIDFGYRLARPFWGKGLATEAASAWVRVAFRDLMLNRLMAIVHPDNGASIRVLQKLGFLQQRKDIVMGMKSIVYCLTPDNQRTQSSFSSAASHRREIVAEFDGSEITTDAGGLLLRESIGGSALTGRLGPALRVTAAGTGLNTACPKW